MILDWLEEFFWSLADVCHKHDWKLDSDIFLPDGTMDYWYVCRKCGKGQGVAE